MWFTQPHNGDLVRLDALAKGEPDPGYDVFRMEKYRRTNVGAIQSRLDEILDALPELFDGPPPADPPGWDQLAA